MRLVFLIKTVASLAIFLCPLGSHEIVYIESWNKGLHQIREKNLNIKLDNENQRYKAQIKDAVRIARYELIARPLFIGEGSGRIIVTWKVELFERKNLFQRLFSREKIDLFATRKSFEGPPSWKPEDFLGEFTPMCDESGREGKCFTCEMPDPALFSETCGEDRGVLLRTLYW
jgi:hypothetical protein